MELTTELLQRVRTELVLKHYSSVPGLTPQVRSCIEDSLNRRVVEITKRLACGFDFGDDPELSIADFTELHAEMAISEITDPELAATVEAVISGQFNFEHLVSELVDTFEASFRGFCEGQGLKQATIERLLAFRQSQL